MTNDLFSLVYLIQWKKNSFFSKGGGAVRFLYAVNVVIPMIILFCSFHNDTSVVWISKTVSIDATYL